MYIFPYITKSGTIINSSSNDAEWNGEMKGGFLGELLGAISGAAQFIGGLVTNLVGSQSTFASLFPAPTWGGGKGGTPPEFSFDLVLINDNVIKARNNYMCVNTIIHNNRWIQKAILAFPGALYEIWLPTGQRHLMCTGTFNLTPLGLNRLTPPKFFTGNGKGSPKIGSNMGDAATIVNDHIEEGEVIPDAYQLSITFKSCLANNMNNAVFQYYVEMSKYTEGSKD